MDLYVQGEVPPGPFLGARDLFETEYDLQRPVHVRVREDPDERTWAAHYDDRHVLNISQMAATSTMARELALHELAHMRRHEQSHPSHTLRTEEALFLALTGREVEQRVLTHCYQIANHVRDIYADDITLAVGPSDKLVSFLESELASSLADQPAAGPRTGLRLTAGADPQMTAVNAAFALALLERHDAITDKHRIYDLAEAAGSDAPEIDLDAFRRLFRELAQDPDESDCRRGLVDAIRTYVDAHETTSGPAAD